MGRGSPGRRGWNWPRLRRFLHHCVRINRLVRTGCSVPAWPLLRAHAPRCCDPGRGAGSGGLLGTATSVPAPARATGAGKPSAPPFAGKTAGPGPATHWTPNRLSGGRQRTSRGSRGCTTAAPAITPRGNRGRAVERPLDGRRRLRRNRRSGRSRGWRWDNRLRRGRRLEPPQPCAR